MFSHPTPFHGKAAARRALQRRRSELLNITYIVAGLIIRLQKCDAVHTTFAHPGRYLTLRAVVTTTHRIHPNALSLPVTALTFSPNRP